MIITNLSGGLGNQMFQYACGRALTLELNLPHKVAIDMFGNYIPIRSPELLTVFSPNIEVAPRADLRRMIGASRAIPVVRKMLSRPSLSGLRGRRFIAEPYFRYWTDLTARAQGGGYLHGYWQSERYFAAHKTKLRRDFTFTSELTGSNAEITRMILDSDAVSIHVRRGDYISNAKAQSTHGTCTPEYYFRAINAMLDRVPNARFFAFSDDPQWVAEVLAPRYPGLVLVDHNQGSHSYKDMHLMSLCRHHIIANSSFSWWGAWLNPNPGKIVIAPRQWFVNGTDDRDLLPPTWERM